MLVGTVKWFNASKGFGFIAPGDGTADVFVHLTAVQDANLGTLTEGEEIEFEVVDGAKGRQAARIKAPEARVAPPYSNPSVMSQGANVSRSALPPSKATSASPFLELSSWAWMGYVPSNQLPTIPRTLSELRNLALDESWTFGPKSQSRDRFPEILQNYLIYTFYRLKLEGKVLIEDFNGEPVAAFNTGLVDSRYEPIFAMFEPNHNKNARQYWKLSGFCIPAEDYLGKKLVRSFGQLPRSARYFDRTTELIYDVGEENSDIKWDMDHVILDNVERLPRPFIEDHRPANFDLRSGSEVEQMEHYEKQAYFKELAAALKTDLPTYRQIINRVKDAVTLASKRAKWNFKTAIPTWSPTNNTPSLLLPLALLTDQKADVALVVERTKAGTYLGHTILTLADAYKNARLICQPLSDWLVPDEIAPEYTEVNLVETNTHRELAPTNPPVHSAQNPESPEEMNTPTAIAESGRKWWPFKSA
jgi:cold shock CspA family protein